MRFPRMGARCALSFSLALCAAALGCDYRELQPIDPAVSQSFEVDVRGSSADVDLLFVIDDSGSMKDEQESLRREIPQLVRDLTTPPLDESGSPRWNAAESLRIAVVTPNMGTAGAPTDPTRVGSACAMNGFLGEDGAPRTCAGGTVSQWEAGDDVVAFVDAIGACANVGDGGCGLEQPLAATVAGLARVGFPREGALLGVVVVSDEEDCSLRDPVAFLAGPEVGPQINQLCYQATDLLTPVSVIVDGLLDGRDPADLVFAALVGVPEALAGESFDAILASESMQYRLTNAGDLGVEPACERAERVGAGETEILGSAAPGRRFVETARALDGFVASICAESYQPAIAELARRIGGRVQGICTVRDLVPDESGAVRCAVREALPPGMSCADLVARTFHSYDESGREVCVVDQAVDGVREGWFYDVSDPVCSKVSYTEGIAPPAEVGVALSCLSRLEETDPGSAAGP